MKNLLLIGSSNFVKRFTNIFSEKIQSYNIKKYIIDKNSLDNIDDEIFLKYKRAIYLFPEISDETYKFFNSISDNCDISYFFNIESINLKFKNKLYFGIPHVSINEIKNDCFFVKVFEKFVALIILILISPVLIIIGIAIILIDGFPIFFTQERVGLNGKKFTIYKFRTLKNSTPQYMKSSKKISDHYTKIGLFLRNSNIDEIPQLLNVLNGTMSFIGPRPEMSFIVEEYNIIEKMRLKVKPGLSGVWQLSKAREREIHQNLEHDFDYMIRKSFLLDIKLFFKTVFKILK